MKHIFAVLVLTTVQICAHAQQLKSETETQPCVFDKAMRVAVFADGKIEINGKATQRAHVRTALKAGSGNAKEVCWYQQHSEAAELDASMDIVLNALVELHLQLPIVLYSDPLFQKRNVLKFNK